MGFGKCNWMKKVPNFTPFGRHYYTKRLPFCVSSVPEVFQKCIAQNLENLEGHTHVGRKCRIT